MTDVFPLLEQARLLYVQHAPPKLLDETVPVAVLCLLVGVGVSVLGARFARLGTTLAFAGVGGIVGQLFARESGFPPPLCVVGGALVVGTIAFQTFRLWVGLATAVLFAGVALGVFGYQRVLPHVGTFHQSAMHSAADSEATFTLPTPSEQQAYRQRTPDQWGSEFWSFLQRQDARIPSNARSLTLAALLTGLCVGVVAVRWSLIFSTSLLGTGLVVAGIGTLLSVFAQQEFYQAFQKHPGVVGMAVGGFLLTSFLLQTLLTRSAPAPGPKAKSALRS